HAKHVVHAGILAHGADDTQRDADEYGEAEREARKLGGDRNARHNLLERGPLGHVGIAKVAPREATDPGGVLNDDRLVEAELRLDLRLFPWINVARRIVEDIDDVSGHHPQHHEDDDRYPEQGQDHQREAPREISTQESVLSYGVRRSLHPRPAKRGEGIGVSGCRCSAQRSSQTSSKRQPLYELFVMMVTP